MEEPQSNGCETTDERFELEKKRIQDEFNMQRAKMKELFLQKEAELERRNEENNVLKAEIIKLKHELDDVKSQLVVDSITFESNIEVEKRKANEEIASLNRLVHETVEESSSTRSLYDNELRKLQEYIHQLQNEIYELKSKKLQSPQNNSQEHSLAPSVVLNALTKGIVKKLGADNLLQDEAQKEDNEELRSLVEPLEDQIQALKAKLRETDDKLQKCFECGHQSEEGHPQTSSKNTSFDSQKQEVTCDMCSNYEAELVREQKRTNELEAKVAAAEKSVERHREDLLKEIGFRKEMEEKWNEKKEEHKQQVAELTRITECAEQDLKELRRYFDQVYKEMRESLSKLTQDRERIHAELEKLQNENDNLTGKYTVHSQELQSEAINLPDTVEALHELVLKGHQDLIIAKIGKEAAEEKNRSLESDIMLLKDQILNERHEKESLEDSLIQDNEHLRQQKNQLEKEKKVYISNQEKLVSSERANQQKIADMQEQINALQLNIKQLEGLNTELKSKVYSLQQELDNSEAVQKDFVRLSQSLQVQLEKIREADTQVRWQHEEDVEQCPSCKSGFSHSKKKTHCSHCGQIFCLACLSRTVKSGPNMRSSRVCDVCHTLLVKSSAPYFSEAPPMT